MVLQREENKGVELTGGGTNFLRMQNEGPKKSKTAPLKSMGCGTQDRPTG
jgi:hypothetical protein